MTRAIARLVVLAGLSLLSGLWPMPDERAASLRHDAITKLATPVSSHSPSAQEESARQFYQSIADNTDMEFEFWIQWTQTLAIASLCVLAGTMMYRQIRAWPVLIVASTALYAWKTTLFYPIYFFFWEADSIDQFFSRLSMLASSPLSFAAIAWFNLLVPIFLSVAVVVAIKALLPISTQRSETNNVHIP